MSRHFIFMLCFILVLYSTVWSASNYKAQAFQTNGLQREVINKKEYLSNCPDVSLQTWGEYQKSLKNLNKDIYLHIQNLYEINKDIEENVNKIAQSLKEISENVANRDISANVLDVLRFMDKVKGNVSTIRSAIKQNQDMIQRSYANVAEKYCIIGKYIVLFQDLAKKAKAHKEEGTYANYIDIVHMLQEKQQILAAILKQFDEYLGNMKRLYQLMENKLNLITSMQYHIVTYVDEVCKPRIAAGQSCVYHMQSDLRCDEAELYHALKEGEQSFIKLVALVEKRFKDLGSSSSKFSNQKLSCDKLHLPYCQ